MHVAPFCLYPISERNPLIQTASHVASVAAIYSASVDESATVGCLLLLHDIAPPANMNAYPVTDLLVSGSFPSLHQSIQPELFHASFHQMLMQLLESEPNT